MWSYRAMQDAETRREGDTEMNSPRPPVAVSPRLIALLLLLTAHCLLLTASRRDMQDQPKAIAYRENAFFKDGTGSRALVEGTVARGHLREDRAFYFGKKASAQPSPASPQTQPAVSSANNQ